MMYLRFIRTWNLVHYIVLFAFGWVFCFGHVCIHISKTFEG